MSTKSHECTLEDWSKKFAADRKKPDYVRYCEGLNKNGTYISKRVFWGKKYVKLPSDQDPVTIRKAIQAFDYHPKKFEEIPVGMAGGMWYNVWYESAAHTEKIKQLMERLQKQVDEEEKQRKQRREQEDKRKEQEEQEEHEEQEQDDP